MKEAFCYKCGKPGAWPLCKECRKGTEPEPKEPVKKKPVRKVFQHHQDYFEAILQIRSKGGPTEEEVWDIIYALKDEKDFEAWKKKDEIQFTDVRAARAVAKALEKRFGLQIIQTRKDIGFDRMRSKKQFKWTVCVRDEQ